jgi:hypothetical protein
MKIEIKSDGTISGTQVKVDGIDITGTSEVVGVEFTASCVYSDGYTDFSYLMREGKGENAKLTRKSFSQRKDDTSRYTDSDVDKAAARPSIGKSISEDDVKILLASQRLVGDNFGKYAVKTSALGGINVGLLNDMIRTGVVNNLVNDSDNSGDDNKEDKKDDESG